MKKRIISAVLILAMVLAMTTTVFADNSWESDIDTLGVAVVDGVYYHDLQAAVNAANGGVVKLLEEPAVTINNAGNLSLDLNGFSATVEGGTVTLIDSATDSGTEGGKVYGNFTVANRVTQKGAIRYVVLDGTDSNGAYKTANAVRVKVSKINVRPSRVGMYYVTQVVFNKNVANAGASYGVALSLKDKPGSNFENDSDTRWTSFTAPTGADFSENGTSCLVTDIMKNDGSSNETNSGRGAMKIYANAYVNVNVNGTTTAIMMENTDVVYSLQTVMQTLDTKLEAELQAYADGTGSLSDTGSKALGFFEAWEGAMTQNGWNLTNLAKALLKKKG